MSALNRVAFEASIAWIDGATRCLEIEEVVVEAAAGRVAAADLRAGGPIPPVDCAAIDGFAVRAEESVGAGAYNPITVPAVAVEAGAPMPPQADAIVPLDQGERDGSSRTVLVEPLAAGTNVDCRGAVAGVGMLLVAAGTRLAPRHLGMLALAGFKSLSVIRRPRVRLVIAGRARSGAPIDSNRPMLRALIERDGGVTVEAGLDGAFEGGVDILLVAGGSGCGRDDRAAAALAAAGSLAIHGVALMPGETAGFGLAAGGMPALLLPGAPAACLWNYELFAGRAIRRLGGHNPELPYCSASVTLARKIVSPIGITEICAIRRLADDTVEPVMSFAEAGLTAAVDADGFAILPAASEGYPAGARVIAYFYDKH